MVAETQQSFVRAQAFNSPQTLTYLQAATSSLHNLTAWAFNVTRRSSGLEEVFRTGPRIFTALGSIVSPFSQMPRQIGTSPGKVLQSASPDEQLHRLLETRSMLDHGLGSSGSIEELGSTARAAKLSLDSSARSLGSVFSYATSKWAVSCITMAIILNRTHIFAATRRRLRLRWHTRLLLRGIPILLLISQAVQLLQSIQCQTSPNFGQLRWGDADKASNLAYAYPIAFLNNLSSALLLGATDRHSCEAVSMIPSIDSQDAGELRGSLSLLWPSFGVMCLSHFIETLSCAVQGRPVSAETGMTLFEQSLAFAEADAAVNYHLGWDALPKHQENLNPKVASLATSLSVTRSLILGRVNTPPEVLLIAWLSSMTHLFSQILGVFDAQSRYRLFNTGFWGACFIFTIIRSVLHFDLRDPSAQGLLRFPTVCVIGFVPHILVLSGILVCSVIYALTFMLSLLALPVNIEPSSMSLRQRLAYAQSNMQANVSLAEVRITRDMDFYTALLRTGFAAITMASEAVYLNQERGVTVHQHTWLEEARLRELEELQRQSMSIGIGNAQYDQIGTIGLVPVKSGSPYVTCGYSRERAAQKVSKSRRDKGMRASTGLSERSSRWLLALDFSLALFRLIGRISALAILWALDKFRIRHQPSWLLWLACLPKAVAESQKYDDHEGAVVSNQEGRQSLDRSQVPFMEGIDVEAEYRRINAFQDEESLDADLYRYWISGGWWGSNDASGDYIPDECDETWDATSVTSNSSLAVDRNDNGQSLIQDDNDVRISHKTSTISSRESTPLPDTALDTMDLARLLHPSTSEEREEASKLSAHLQSDIVLTRSAYRYQEQLRRSQVLLGTVSNSDIAGILRSRQIMRQTQDDEQILEQTILTRRRPQALSSPQALNMNEGSSQSKDGSSLPCVVCHTSMRTVILWPCRCLSLCDDCRVSLAMNNFDKCVCCRRDVRSFSRIFIP